MKEEARKIAGALTWKNEAQMNGVTIGSYYSNKTWTVFVRTKEYTSRSLTTIGNVPKLIDNFKKAKEIIASKVEE